MLPEVKMILAELTFLLTAIAGPTLLYKQIPDNTDKALPLVVLALLASHWITHRYFMGKDKE